MTILGLALDFVKFTIYFHRVVLRSSYDYHPGDYPRFAVTVDLAVFTIRDDALQVLLIERGEEPFLGAWALPGGFVRPDEDLDEAAARELAEETGLRASPSYLEQLGSYGTPDRDPRMRVVTVAYWAIYADLPGLRGGGDAAAAAVTPVEEIERGRVRLAFDHERIVRDAVERTRAKLEYTALAARFCPRSSRSASFAASTKRCGTRASIRGTSNATSRRAARSRSASRPRRRRGLVPGARRRSGRSANRPFSTTGPRCLWTVRQRNGGDRRCASRRRKGRTDRVPAGNCLERLKGFRSDQHSIRINDRYRVTTDTALRLSRLLKMSPQFWMRLQADWDLHRAAERAAS